MSGWVDWFNLIAAERGVPDGWRWFNTEFKGESRATGVFIVKGAVFGEVFKSGKNKGKPNPAKRTDERELVITPAQLDEFKARWEQTNGKCSECYGEGKTVKSISAEGKTYRDCSRCKATGKAPTP